MPPGPPCPPWIPRGQISPSPRAAEATGEAGTATRARPESPARRSRRLLVAPVLSVALLAATTLAAAPAALARSLDPGPPAPIPRPAARPADPATRPADGGATRRPRPRDLASLRTEATRLRAKQEDQHRRLEVLAEDLEEAYARGVDLLADAARLDRRRRNAE